MIELGNNRFIVQRASELPDYTGATEIFCDVETTTFDPEKSGPNPFGGDRICGIAITADDDPAVFYVPTRCHRGGNVDNWRPWLARTLKRCKDWINHNIVFDAIMCAHDGAMFDCRLVDTLTLSKIHDSDRFNHGLKNLSQDWLNREVREQSRLKAYLKGIKSKDYGDVPADMIGDYACEDVQSNRELYRFLQRERPEEQESLWDTEIKLTSVLFDMEWLGLRIDPVEVKKDFAKRLRSMIATAERLEEISGREFTNSHACVYDILINQFGLPVLMRKGDDEDANSTFNKKALAMYEVHPSVTSDPRLVELIELIRQYRDDQYLCGHYKSWLELKDEENYIHPSYNQVVRTGRMSCRNPNIQGVNKLERELILPDPGHGFMCCDYSQIEFRLIVHYIGDRDAIAAYRENPKTDFHQWVAEMIGIGRSSAKRINFGMGYGAGKKKVTSEVAAEKDIIAELSPIVNEMVARGEIRDHERASVFASLCQRRAYDVYDAYHSALPGIKRTAREAQITCKNRGYVFNAYKRRRHLPATVARKAFNAIIQGSAMDIMKERMVALSPRFNPLSRDIGLTVRLNVHDEVGNQLPEENLFNPETQRYVKSHLESPSVEFAVPILCGMGISMNNWREASDDKISGTDERGRPFGCIF